MNNDFDNWVGKKELRVDNITIASIWGFYNVMDIPTAKPKIGDPIPPGAHWCFFLPYVPMRDVGPDGHPKRGDFMPDPKGLPRRMFAGSDLIFFKDLCVGDTVERQQKIVSVTQKMGKTGKLLFVKVEEEYSTNGEIALLQKNDIVYREPPKKNKQNLPKSKVAKKKPVWERSIKTNPTMLFKYSAITLNGHRIHYDYPYAVEEEGYPDLVVHGPLTATILMDLCTREKPEKKLKSFCFRAIAPIFCNELFAVKAEPRNLDCSEWDMWAENTNGHICMTAQAIFDNNDSKNSL